MTWNSHSCITDYVDLQNWFCQQQLQVYNLYW